MLILFLQHPERDFSLKISALEIYNETVVDLLNRSSGPLRLLDDPEVLAAACLRSFSYVNCICINQQCFGCRKEPLSKS